MEGWQLLKDRYYRKYSLYALDDDPEVTVDLSSNKFLLDVSMAPNGGPIAVHRQPKRAMNSRQGNALSTLLLCTGSGRVIYEHPVN
jgi:hypothetical protein